VLYACDILFDKVFFSTGEYGKPVNIVKEELSDEERVNYDAAWQKNVFNEFASDKISLHRSLPDVRDPE
jgi:polypeptide N-acetylgalactosaminyltransferase